MFVSKDGAGRMGKLLLMVCHNFPPHPFLIMSVSLFLSMNLSVVR